MGPFYIEDDQKLTIQRREYAWNQQGMMIFVDQPLNTGLSYSDSQTIVNDTHTASNHFTNFLYNFYQTYPSFQKNPLYITGESYGGHYVPQFTEDLHRSGNFSEINFAGIAIGDGWVNPMVQGIDYDTFFYVIGVGSQSRTKYFKQVELNSLIEFYRGNFNLASQLVDIPTMDLDFSGNINDENFQLYYDISTSLIDWINQNKKGYGIPDQINYDWSNDTIYQAFEYDNVHSFQSSVQYLLQNGINTLIYNGQNDMQCNAISQFRWIDKIDWTSIGYWKTQPKKFWCLPDQNLAGTFKQFKNFNFVLVYDAGHLVPWNTPKSATVMLQNFLSNNWTAC